MSTDGFGYAVDLGELDAVTQDLDRSQEKVKAKLDQLDRLMSGLPDVWTGLAATAQQDAHHRWSQEARSMHEALVALHAAAGVAHRNYGAAIASNLTMWQQLR